MITDTIGDCFSRIRNAAKARQTVVLIPYSKLKESVVALLKGEGFVTDVSVKEESKGKKFLAVTLKFEDMNTPILEHIKRVSKPGHRIYGKVPGSKGVRDGLGFRILSTSKGVLTDRQAAQLKVGGEIIGEVW